jgi:hypothetical protein
VIAAFSFLHWLVSNFLGKAIYFEFGDDQARYTRWGTAGNIIKTRRPIYDRTMPLPQITF